jgi:hypothetical protein
VKAVLGQFRGQGRRAAQGGEEQVFTRHGALAGKVGRDPSRFGKDGLKFHPRARRIPRARDGREPAEPAESVEAGFGGQFGRAPAFLF